MPIYFITGNKNKFAEASALIPGLKQIELDLPEIQEIDAKKIIAAKLKEALQYKQGEFIVEDTSLYLDCLQGLPGPLIKWFLEAQGCKGLADMAKKLGNVKASAKTIIGYTDGRDGVRYFSGAIAGKIIAPKEKSAFGWDPIFCPQGYKKSFAALTPAEKNKISMRGIAFRKLKKFLSKNKPVR